MTSKVVKCIHELKTKLESLNTDPENPIVVINKDWNKLVEPIKLIIVGDNPGEKEKKCGVYFHRDGQAGGRARKFARKYLKLDDDKDLNEVVFMNKCPIYSKGTSSLDINGNESVFWESLCLTIRTLDELSKNEDLPILITGISSNKLNRRFYKELFQIEKWEEKFLFSKHFSYNNFHNQLNDCKKSSLEESLKCISNQTKEVLKQRFSSKLKQPICKEII